MKTYVVLSVTAGDLKQEGELDIWLNKGYEIVNATAAHGYAGGESTRNKICPVIYVLRRASYGELPQ